MNTLEMIFLCTKCETPREYGTALNYSATPDNPLPIIQCARCGKATLHAFKQVMQRTDTREKKVFSGLRVYSERPLA